MPKITVKDAESEIKMVSLSQGETILSGLLKAGFEVPYGCRSGVCHSCVLRTSSQDIPISAQKGLRPVEKSQGYFLSCCWEPETHLVVNLSKPIERYQTKVKSLDKLADQVYRMRLDKSIVYRSGQYITLKHSSGTTRSYSISSHPVLDDYIECHIRTYDDGKFSQLVRSEIDVGDSFELLGPYGNCVYEKEDKHKTMFLAALGTGLSPIYGVLRDALTQGHKGKIVVLIANASEDNAYFRDEFDALCKKYPSVEVHYSIQSGVSKDKAMLPKSDVYETAAELFPSLSDCLVFLCGSSSFVQKMRKSCFLRGASLGDIRVDEFLRAAS